MRRRIAWLALAAATIAGCDCGSVKLANVPPLLAVSPSSLSPGLICGETAANVMLRNGGKGLLVVTALSIQGTGWALVEQPHLPLTLPGNARVNLSLQTTGGDASLVVSSNDPNHPMVSVPLHSALNQAPMVSITAPAMGAVVPEGSDLMLTGTVSDDSDPAGQLAIHWTDGSGTVLSTASANAGGVVAYDWPAADRVSGTQTVTLKATDSCGASTTATVTFCQDATTTFQPFDLQGWQYAGTTVFDTTNDWLQITSDQPHQLGSAFETSKMVSGDQVDISFQFYCSDGSGADGFALVALDTTRATSYLGADGCGMGFGADPSCSAGQGLPGWAVEVDTYYNSEVDQTSSIHTAFAFDGDLRDEPIWAPLPDIRDGKWHQMSVSVHAPHVRVTIDGTAYLDSDVTGNFNFPAYVGFTGSTGGLTDNHFINSLNVVKHACGTQ